MPRGASAPVRDERLEVDGAARDEVHRELVDARAVAACNHRRSQHRVLRRESEREREREGDVPEGALDRQLARDDRRHVERDVGLAHADLHARSTATSITLYETARTRERERERAHLDERAAVLEDEYAGLDAHLGSAGAAAASERGLNYE